MANAQIVRKSFNGGEIAPELHYRSDLEMYHNACKSLKNMTVTPWGAATRRPPTELLAKIDTAVAGVPVKYVPFRFSLTETFHIIFTDGSGSASPDSETADVIVFDADGALQTLDSVSTKILTTPYDPDDLILLHYIQVNDFIYMACGGLYPVHALSRFFDSAQDANRWKVEEWELVGGPLNEENTDRAKSLQLVFNAYDEAATYAAGDVVSSVDSGTVYTPISGVLASSVDGVIYPFLLVTNASAPDLFDDIAVGDVIDLSETTFSDGSTQFTLSGPFAVVKTFKNSTHTYVGFNYLIDPGSLTITEGDGSFSIIGSSSNFYRSKINGNTEPLTDFLSWESLSAYSGEAELRLASDVFEAADVGRQIALRDETLRSYSATWTSNQESIVFAAQGEIQLTTEGGAWGGTLKLMQSFDNGISWEELGAITSAAGQSNGSISRTVDRIDSLVRVELANYNAQSGYDLNACAWRLELINKQYRFFEITAFTDARSVMVETQSPVVTAPNGYQWAWVTFSENDGYPNTLCIHDERMILGGNRTKPNTVWASRVNDWKNFMSGDLETSPYTFTVKSDSFDTIRWLRSTRQLMIGTENSESTMGTRDPTAVISPTNIDVQTHTYFGSASIQAVVTADLVFFVQGQRERVRSTQYDFGTDQYLSSEMSILAHHITSPGIREMSFRRHPYSSIFFVLDDGRAVSFTYERDNQVKGWARFDMGGGATIVSASANYSEAGDIIGGIIKRGSAYYLETFGTFDAETVFLDSQTRFVDEDYSAGVTLPYADTTGLVVVLDDALLDPGDYTIVGTTLTIPGETSGALTVGFPFDFEVQPTDIIELGDHGTKKRISKLSMYLLASGGCDVSVNDEDSPFQAGDNLAAGDRLTGEYEISVGGGTESAIRIKLSGNHHKPFNLSAFGVYGQQSR